jgi:hypothetical protein
MSPSSLDNLRLAQPCPASWDDMPGDDRVRFCRDCQLHVYNLSALSRREAEGFLQARDGRTCLFFYRRADGTILTQDCPVGLRATRRGLRLLLGAAALALLVAGAQLAGYFGSAGRRERSMAWLRDTKPVRAARQVEPFKTVLEWFDPTPVDCTLGW